MTSGQFNPGTGRAADSDVDKYKRPPDAVMHLARIGCFHQTRISFINNIETGLNAELSAIGIAFEE